jgi:hypothetical protein
MWTLYQIIDVCLGGARPNVARATVYLDRLDALGSTAAAARALAHNALAQEARRRDSVSLQEHESTAAEQAMHEMSEEDRREYALFLPTIYRSLADARARQNDAAGAMQVMADGERALTMLQASRAVSLVHRATTFYAPIGRRASAIVATRWFNTSEQTARPTLGKPALVVFVQHSCGPTCYPGYAVLRRLAAKYTASGMSITLVARTGGYYRNELVRADSETALTARYFMTFLGLPAALAVWQTPLGRRADGHVTVLSAPNEAAYTPPPVPLPVYIIDAKGVIRFVSSLSLENEAALDDVLASLY